MKHNKINGKNVFHNKRLTLNNNFLSESENINNNKNNKIEIV